MAGCTWSAAPRRWVVERARPGQGNRSDLGKRKRPFTQAELAEVASWARCARRSLAKAAELGEGRAATALRTTAEQMRRLVEAARRFPLYALHLGVGTGTGDGPPTRAPGAERAPAG